MKNLDSKLSQQSTYLSATIRKRIIIMMLTWKIAVDSSFVASPTKLVSLGWLERPLRSHFALLRPTTTSTGK